MEEPRLDDFFRDKLEDFAAPTYDPAAWAKLEPRMPAAAASPVLWYWISASLGALLLFSWLYFLSAPSGERQIVQQLDSLQQQINTLTLSQSQIQKDTVYVYLTDDSLKQLITQVNPANTQTKSLAQAQNSSIGRSTNSRTHTNFNPKSEVISPSVKAEGDLDLTSQPTLSQSFTEEEQAVIPAKIQTTTETGIEPILQSEAVVSTPAENDSSLEQVPINLVSQADTNTQMSTAVRQADTTAILASTDASPADSILSVRPQPETNVKKVRSRILQNWINAREIRAGLQVAGGSMLSREMSGGLRSNMGLHLESNLNENWWFGTGLNFAYRKYEAENEDEGLAPELIAALPGLVDPITAADLKEYYMYGYSLEIPLSLRREFYLNQNWDLGLEARVAAHRYLRQRFDYQSFDEEELSYESTAAEQMWSISPLRLSVMGIHSDRFRPAIGVYAEYDLMQRGLEPIRFWSVGMQASFGLQLR